MSAKRVASSTQSDAAISDGADVLQPRWLNRVAAAARDGVVGISSFVRHRPLVAVGGATATGFLLARLVRR
jgi:ElaB/YqjD/DUF883 family membrane-anchored ribosome-binding protein